MKQLPDLESWLGPYWEQGCRITMVIVAAHESDSLLGMADRFQRGRDTTGIGRWIPLRWHDANYPQIPLVADWLERRAVPDHLYVVDRLGTVLFENHRATGRGGMLLKPGAREAIVRERARPKTAGEDEYFNTRVDQLLNRDPARSPLDPEIVETLTQAVARRRFGGSLLGGRVTPARRSDSIDQRLSVGLIAAHGGLLAPAGEPGLRPTRAAAARPATTRLPAFRRHPGRAGR